MHTLSDAHHTLRQMGDRVLRVGRSPRLLFASPHIVRQPLRVHYNEGGLNSSLIAFAVITSDIDQDESPVWRVGS